MADADRLEDRWVQLPLGQCFVRRLRGADVPVVVTWAVRIVVLRRRVPFEDDLVLTRLGVR